MTHFVPNIKKLSPFRGYIAKREHGSVQPAKHLNGNADTITVPSFVEKDSFLVSPFTLDSALELKADSDLGDLRVYATVTDNTPVFHEVNQPALIKYLYDLLFFRTHGSLPFTGAPPQIDSGFGWTWADGMFWSSVVKHDKAIDAAVRLVATMAPELYAGFRFVTYSEIMNGLFGDIISIHTDFGKTAFDKVTFIQVESGVFSRTGPFKEADSLRDPEMVFTYHQRKVKEPHVSGGLVAELKFGDNGRPSYVCSIPNMTDHLEFDVLSMTPPYEYIHGVYLAILRQRVQEHFDRDSLPEHNQITHHSV